MCGVCGCGSEDIALINMATGQRSHVHVHADGTVHAHDHHHHHDHVHAHPHGHDHHHPADHADHGVAVVDLNARILARNDALAMRNRAAFAEQGLLVLNLMSSPGSGKTTLLERTIRDLGGDLALSVIEGDQATDADGARIRAAGAPAVQVNTGTGCHLEADMIAGAVHELQPPQGSVVFIENVGNLVCPALFDLGERARVIVLSVTEGEDKPLKYPHMFQAAELMIINKIDLAPYVDFDVEKAIGYARQLRPDIETIQLSVRSGEGLDAWYDWIRLGVSKREMST